jgi:hypothetical protein
MGGEGNATECKFIRPRSLRRAPARFPHAYPLLRVGPSLRQVSSSRRRTGCSPRRRRPPSGRRPCSSSRSPSFSGEGRGDGGDDPEARGADPGDRARAPGDPGEGKGHRGDDGDVLQRGRASSPRRGLLDAPSGGAGAARRAGRGSPSPRGSSGETAENPAAGGIRRVSGLRRGPLHRRAGTPGSDPDGRKRRKHETLNLGCTTTRNAPRPQGGGKRAPKARAHVPGRARARPRPVREEHARRDAPTRLAAGSISSAPPTSASSSPTSRASSPPILAAS